MVDTSSPAKAILQPDGIHIVCKGNWVTDKISDVPQDIKYLVYAAEARVIVDVGTIITMDTAGAWMLQNLVSELESANKKVIVTNLKSEQQTIFALVQQGTSKLTEIPAPVVHNWIYSLGEATVKKVDETHNFLAFVGELSIDLLQRMPHLRRMQWRSFLNTIDIAGFRALPIIALLLFSIGIVTGYQAGVQLRNFGSDFYIVNLTGIAILQEFGPLITAIIVAGRTGSAFTAQIGSMMVNQEVDALRSMGLSTINMLVVPRFFGLLIVLPLLTVWADIFGILGSMVMAKHVLSFNYLDYLTRLPRDIKVANYLIGMSKTPVFAMIIATVGCYQGFEVGMSAESIGQKTTKSVVQAIFLIIIVAALFSLMFSW